MIISFPIKSNIDSRRSARSYKMISVEKVVMESIQDFVKSLSVPFDHNVEIKFFNANATKTLYTNMLSPPDNIAFVAETDIISISKVGFIGELLILFAQSKGLSTCWYGHYKLSELESLMPHLQSTDQLKESNMGYGYSKGVTTGRRVICITPLGYYEDGGLRLVDRITKKTSSFKRKDIKDLLENPNDYDKLSDDVLYALDLGRKAPSAANSQMWKFAFENSFKTITVAMTVGYKHFKWEHPNVDIGICACHVWLGLIDKGYNPSVTVSEDSGRAIWKISI
ncbi:nitroreductase [Sedimentibacter acidaminivorans]|uniref:Nitroreductase n=1 Tax=Sedimentibacter acidaminivorans TaxID=913099 RepID=A0ABS4GBY6_9FIRM|nr:nitroreductase family protein [Sedimentibacter acidaminivorans]MBP1925201.1 nitroreductase [Sedimentibacter acidaminivorans]